jgi:hypothetical protein
VRNRRQLLFTCAMICLLSALASAQTAKPEPKAQPVTQPSSNLEHKLRQVPYAATSFKPIVNAKLLDYLVFYAYYTSRDKPPKKPETIVFGYAVDLSSSQISSDAPLNVVADGESIDLGNAQTGTCDDLAFVTHLQKCRYHKISYETFSKIANAKSADFYINSSKFVVPQWSLESFRNLISGKSLMSSKN